MDSGKNYLMPGVSKREVLAWASYDFANSGYTTVILTAVYNAFFVSVVAENAVWATFAWTLTITLSNLLSIAVIPVISALADAKANKRFWLCGDDGHLLHEHRDACLHRSWDFGLSGFSDRDF